MRASILESERNEPAGETSNQKVKNRRTMNPRLLVLAGPRQGAACPIAVDAFTIGRDAQNQLSLLDSSVSREHCLVIRQDGGFMILDLVGHIRTLMNGGQA